MGGRARGGKAEEIYPLGASGAALGGSEAAEGGLEAGRRGLGGRRRGVGGRDGDFGGRRWGGRFSWRGAQAAAGAGSRGWSTPPARGSRVCSGGFATTVRRRAETKPSLGPRDGRDGPCVDFGQASLGFLGLGLFEARVGRPSGVEAVKQGRDEGRAFGGREAQRRNQGEDGDHLVPGAGCSGDEVIADEVVAGGRPVDH